MICFLSLLLVFTGCQTSDSNLEESPAQIRSDSESNVTIKTEKAEYPTTTKTIIVEIQNDRNEDYVTGAHVFLEREVEGTWRKVPMKAEFFTEEGVVHPPNKVSSLSLNVNDLDYKITPGEYRATIGGLAAPFEVVE